MHEHPSILGLWKAIWRSMPEDFIFMFERQYINRLDCKIKSGEFNVLGYTAVTFDLGHGVKFLELT